MNFTEEFLNKKVTIQQRQIEELLEDITSIKYYAFMEDIDKEHPTFFQDIVNLENKIAELAGDEW